jgi:hypothetical protein
MPSTKRPAAAWDFLVSQKFWVIIFITGTITFCCGGVGLLLALPLLMK